MVKGSHLHYRRDYMMTGVINSKVHLSSFRFHHLIEVAVVACEQASAEHHVAHVSSLMHGN